MVEKHHQPCVYIHSDNITFTVENNGHDQRNSSFGVNGIDIKVIDYFGLQGIINHKRTQETRNTSQTCTWQSCNERSSKVLMFI